ncbi:hypothetical protein LZC95_44055 [Pendulispora brunnea]|uniref:Uncharacterized protein n=1 Tax=Pendulispora brunnea TaxID=2905690 RepID=A0ABZ2K443_9BACT
MLSLSLLGGLALGGCSASHPGECLDESNCPGDTPPQNDPKKVVPLCADTGMAHVGLGGVELTAGRLEAVAGADRGRSKPYSALASEYARVLGKDNNPSLLGDGATATTFGQPQARWSLEPQASAVSLYTAYRVAFDGCLQLTGAVANASGSAQGDPKYAAAPDAETAKAQCLAWARKFWSRAAGPDEVQACVEVAVTSSLQETYNGKTTSTPPRRRWAYACASVLSATGFLAY